MARRIKIKRQAVRQRALAVISRMRRRGESLSKAARALHTTPRTVQKFVGKQLRQTASGRYSVEETDRLKRELNVFGPDGYELASVRSFKQAQLASEHLNAVGRFLRTGDTEWLKPFQGKHIGGIELLTDPARILEFAEADLVKLDGLYRDQRGTGEGQ